MKIVSFLFLIIVIVLGVTFAILNAGAVEINYYFASSKVTLSLLLAYVLGVGMLIGLLASLPSLIRLKKDNIKQKNKIKQVKQEVDNLRSIPIKDSH